MIIKTLLLLALSVSAETAVGTCFNECMGNPRNSFAKCRSDCSGQLTKPTTATMPATKVGNGGCSCNVGGNTEAYCRTGSKSFKLSKEQCAKKALELGAAGFEFGGTDNCITHAASPTAGNNYPGVTCYKLVKPPVSKVGNGGCSCRSGGKYEAYCRTGSKSFKLSKEQCAKKAMELGAAGFEFGGTDNCMTHAASPTGGNNYPGVTCYKFGTSSADAMMMVEKANHVSLAIQALALVGFLATAYGAARHYAK